MGHVIYAFELEGSDVTLSELVVSSGVCESAIRARQLV